MDAMKLQSMEFDAMSDLARDWNILASVAVVDDDYPKVRHI